MEREGIAIFGHYHILRTLRDLMKWEQVKGKVLRA